MCSWEILDVLITRSPSHYSSNNNNNNNNNKCSTFPHVMKNFQLSHMAHFLWSATCHWSGHFCHLSMSCNIMYILVIVYVTKKPCGNENGHLRTALSSCIPLLKWSSFDQNFVFQWPAYCLCIKILATQKLKIKN